MTLNRIKLDTLTKYIISTAPIIFPPKIWNNMLPVSTSLNRSELVGNQLKKIFY